MEEFLAKLTTLLGDEAKAKEVAEKAKNDGVTDLASAAELIEADLVGYGVPKVKARVLLKDLKAATATAPTAPTAAAPVIVSSLLPVLPSDDSLLEALVTGGTLRFEPMVAVHAMRALVGDKIGIYDIENKALELIEARAERDSEQVPDLFFDIERGKLKKKHAEVLRAMNVNGGFVSAGRKKAFLTRFAGIWDALAAFHDQLAAWRRLCKEEAADLSNLAEALRGGGALADVPPYDHLIDAARGLVDEINKMFGATGVIVAQALSADAMELRKIIDRPELVSAIGATSRDGMLRDLGVSVGHDMARAEKNAATYVLAVLDIKNKDTVTLQRYLTDLYKLGETIGFDRLRSASRPNGGTLRPDGSTPPRGKSQVY